MEHYGQVDASSTLYIPFTTHAQTGAALGPSTAFETADVRIYKNGSATQRSSEAGYTMTSPFDSLTGLHLLAIDLSDNTDASFYAAGSQYFVVLSPDETVDGLSVVKVLADFRIGPISVNVTQNAGTAIVSSAGKQDVNVATIAASAITATSIATGAITSAKFAASAIDAAAIATDAFTAAKFAADCIDASALAADAVTEIVTAMASSCGIITSGTLVTATSTTATLAVATAYADDVIVGSTILITGGTGVGQARTFVDWTNTGDLGTVDPVWVTTPDATSTYVVFATPPGTTTILPEVNVTQIDGEAVTASGGIPEVRVATITAGAITEASIDDDAITDAKVASDVTVNITSNIKRNQALADFEFLMTDSTNHAPATGLTCAATRSIDGGAFAVGTLAGSTGLPTEVGSGIYKISFGTGDLNGKCIVLKVTATGADTTFERIITAPI